MARDYKVVPFKRWHVGWLLEDGDAEQGAFQPGNDALVAIEKLGTSWTIVLDGQPLLCSGTIEQWPGRHMAWAYLSRHTGRHMYYVTMRVIEYLARAQGRIETTVRADYEKGHRWAKMLGFTPEAYMWGYGPDGEDHVSYVMFNDKV
jgi:hypothetical protein